MREKKKGRSKQTVNTSFYRPRKKENMNNYFILVTRKRNKWLFLEIKETNKETTHHFSYQKKRTNE